MRLVHREAELFLLANSLAKLKRSQQQSQPAIYKFIAKVIKSKIKTTQTVKFEWLKLELLPRFELGTSSLPTAVRNFLQSFLGFFSCFCSGAIHFQHFLNVRCPLFRRLSVAGYVVKPTHSPAGGRIHSMPPESQNRTPSGLLWEGTILYRLNTVRK